ncbi:hypothetical protein BX666DRAFT_644630 [Dichotomocladium elegans]|nr:hypothetical protein BX666DRAFT_644630 [Dichotomocladium elegans]
MQVNPDNWGRQGQQRLSEPQDYADVLSAAEKIELPEDGVWLDPDKTGMKGMTMLIVYLKMEAFVYLARFDDAAKQLKEYCSSATPDQEAISLCERMAGIVLQHPECPPENAFTVLQSLTGLFQRAKDPLKQTVAERFGRWIRMTVSTALIVSKGAGFECLKSVMEYLKHEKTNAYPESELYYIVVVAWNEGITSLLCPEGRAWCVLAFDLLALLRDSARRTALQTKMTNAFRALVKDKTS